MEVHGARERLTGNVYALVAILCFRRYARTWWRSMPALTGHLSPDVAGGRVIQRTEVRPLEVDEVPDAWPRRRR